MRDLGILIWVGLLIVGVVGSMRRQIRGRAAAQPRRVPEPVRPPPPSQWTRRIAAPAAPPSPQPRAPRPPPRPVAAPVEPTAHREVSRPSGPAPGCRPLFGGKSEIVRAVVASEILGKPRALNDEYFGR